MNRQLNCMVSRAGDTAGTLAEELVLHGFIHTLDSSLIQVNNYIHQRSSNNYIIISSMWEELWHTQVVSDIFIFILLLTWDVGHSFVTPEYSTVYFVETSRGYEGHIRFAFLRVPKRAVLHTNISIRKNDNYFSIESFLFCLRNVYSLGNARCCVHQVWVQQCDANTAGCDSSVRIVLHF